MKRTPLYISLITLIFAGLFVSCQNEDQNEHPFSFINLEFYELSSGEGNQLYFHLSSMETFPCSNFSLDVIVNQQTSQTDIRIADIMVPDNCITSIGPATYLLPLGPLENGSHKFSLWVHEKRHEFRLVTDSEKIVVQKDTPFQNNLVFKHDSVLRIPAHTVWGYITYDNQQVWEDLQAAFRSAGATDIELADGNYYFFKVDDGKIAIEITKQLNESFYFRFDSPVQQLIDAYEQVMENHQPSEVQLRLFTASGQQFVL